MSILLGGMAILLAIAVLAPRLAGLLADGAGAKGGKVLLVEPADGDEPGDDGPGPGAGDKDDDEATVDYPAR